MTIGAADRKLGNRGQITADVTLDDVTLGPEAVLGEVGCGLKVALQTLPYRRIGIGAAEVGMAQAPFDRNVAHLKSRSAFGGTLASKQHRQFLMAGYAAEIEGDQTLYLKAALRIDVGERFPEP